MFCAILFALFQIFYLKAQKGFSVDILEANTVQSAGTLQLLRYPKSFELYDLSIIMPVGDVIISFG